MADSVEQERILLPHDLRRHLEDRLGALVEAARQPARALHAFGQELPFGLALGAPGDTGVVALVDEDPWQRVRIEFDRPAPVRCVLHEDIRHDRIRRAAAEGEARFRVERPDLGQHVEQVVLGDAAQLLQRREVASRQKLEIGDHRLHCGIVPVAPDELERKAFGQAAGENACGIKSLAGREHPLDLAVVEPGAKRDIVGRHLQISGLVETVREFRRDHSVRAVGEREGDLLRDMVPERELRCRHGVDVEAVAGGSILRGRLPLRREAGIQRLAGSRIIRKDVLQRRVQPVRYRFGGP